MADKPQTGSFGDPINVSIPPATPEPAATTPDESSPAEEPQVDAGEEAAASEQPAASPEESVQILKAIQDQVQALASREHVPARSETPAATVAMPEFKVTLPKEIEQDEQLGPAFRAIKDAAEAYVKGVVDQLGQRISGIEKLGTSWTKQLAQTEFDAIIGSFSGTVKTSLGDPKNVERLRDEVETMRLGRSARGLPPLSMREMVERTLPSIIPQKTATRTVTHIARPARTAAATVGKSEKPALNFNPLADIREPLYDRK